MKKLKIAILGNCHKEHPGPKNSIFAPGLVATEIADGLAGRGHKVDLYAPKGSKTKAKLVSFGLPSVYKLYDKSHGLASAYYTRQFAQADLLNFTAAISKLNKGEYDIIHSHDIRSSATLAAFAKRPILHTLHTVLTKNNLSPFEQYALKTYYAKNLFVAVSSRQALLLDKKLFNVKAIIPHGVNLKQFSFNPKGGEYALFAGRLTPDKGAHLAVQACLKAKHPLVLVGNIPTETGARKYWAEMIEPHLGPLIKYAGHISPKKISRYYRAAKVLLFPSQVEESFGLVVVEALASGTPVIGADRGIVRDAVISGKTGLLANTEKQLVAALAKSDQLDRAACRQLAEEKFSLERMLDDYEKLYQEIA